jgi:hypothetical protein
MMRIPPGVLPHIARSAHRQSTGHRACHSPSTPNLPLQRLRNSKWVLGGLGGVLGGFGGGLGGAGVGAAGGRRGGGGGGRLRQRFFGFLRSEATRLLLKLRAGLFEAAGYCIYSVPQIRYLHGHARCTGQPKTGCETHGNENRPPATGHHRPWADALGSTLLAGGRVRGGHGGGGVDLGGPPPGEGEGEGAPAAALFWLFFWLFEK